MARQAMASSASPLTITAALDESAGNASPELTLSVSNVDNGDWNTDLRPDSRVHGFQGAILSVEEPSVTRSFSTNATASVVTFTLVGSLTSSTREVFRLALSYHGTEGWYLISPGTERVPFGQNPGGNFNISANVRVSTRNNPAELLILIE